MSESWGWPEALSPGQALGLGFPLGCVWWMSGDLGAPFLLGFPQAWLQRVHPPNTGFARLWRGLLFQRQTKRTGLLVRFQVSVQEV